MKRIALLAAVRQELAPLARRLQPVPQSAPLALPAGAALGRIGSLEVLLIPGGMGARRAEIAAETIVQARRPDMLVITGVAGALDPELDVRDIVAADLILDGDEGTLLEPSVVAALPAGDLHGLRVRRGTLLSIDRVLVTADEKRAVFRAPNALLNAQRSTPNSQLPIAVEMETAAAARVAIRQGVPWAAVRATSDRADESLPLDFNQLRDEEGDIRTSRVARAALAHPATIPGLIRLGRNTAMAAEALASFLVDWLRGATCDPPSASAQEK